MQTELSDEIRRDVEQAERAWEDLRAAGRELHFELDETSGAVVASLRALDGRVLRALSLPEVLDVAAGMPVLHAA